MRMQKIFSALALVVFGMVLMAATSSRPAMYEARPRMVQEGVVIVSVDKNSSALNPLRYLVTKVDGPWIEVQLLKKKKRDKKGSAFWLRIHDIGAFVVEE